MPKTEDKTIEEDKFTIDWNDFGDYTPSYSFGQFSEQSSTPNVSQDEEPETPPAFSTDIFSSQSMPAAYYLDPDGYKEIWNRYKRPNREHWRKLCPNTYNAAMAVLGGVSETFVDWECRARLSGPTVWGRNQIGSTQWITYTAGQRASRGKWSYRPMQFADVISALGNPQKYSVGSKTGQEIHQLRIDIDMDDAHEEEDHATITTELEIECSVLTSLGSVPYFFRTGNRGHQIIVPVPAKSPTVLKFLLDVIKYLLKTHPRKSDSRVKIDKSNLDGMLRLPFGRHAFSDNVGWMVDPRTAELFPLEQQVQALTDAFTPCSNYTALDDIPEDIPEGLAAALEHVSGTKLHAMVKDCCQQFNIPFPETIVQAPVPTSEIVAYPVSATPTQVGLGWAKKVIDDGFEPGGFWAWAHNSKAEDHKNGIGAAILFWGADIPGNHSDPIIKERRDEYVIEKLIEYVHKVPANSESSMNERIAYIRRMVPQNNISRFYIPGQLKQHKEIDGDILEAETELATQAVKIIVQKRLQSNMRRKKFDEKPLKLLHHIVELIQVAFRNSAGTIHISQRTLCSEIGDRWPEDSTDGKNMQRILEWITQGKNRCVFEMLIPVERNGAFSAMGYLMGGDYIGLIPCEA